MPDGLRLGIMQPYFFPYPGHFALIAAVDEWVVFDISQYTPKTWMNRNRILHPRSGWQYVTVPLSNSSIHIRTSDARVMDPAAARAGALGKLSHYKGRAPFYQAVRQLVAETFDAHPPDSLVQLNVSGLRAVCGYLEMPFAYRICSELALDLPAELGPGDWALEISARLGAGTYVNPASGRALFDPAAFARRGIHLQVAHTASFEYPTPGYEFVPNLSILDALMWNAPAVVRSALHEGLQLESLS